MIAKQGLRNLKALENSNAKLKNAKVKKEAARKNTSKHMKPIS